MKPHQIITLMQYAGTDNTYAMGDHDDHIHVGFRPQSGDDATGKATAAVLQPGQWSRLDRAPRRDREPRRAAEAEPLRGEGQAQGPLRALTGVRRIFTARSPRGVSLRGARDDALRHAAACAACGAGLDADQRYCLDCGAATPAGEAARRPRRSSRSRGAATPVPAPAAAAAGAPRLPSCRAARSRSRLAVGVFAFVLGTRRLGRARRRRAARARRRSRSPPHPRPRPRPAAVRTRRPSGPRRDGRPAPTDAAPARRDRRSPCPDVPVADVPRPRPTEHDHHERRHDDVRRRHHARRRRDTTAADAPTTPPAASTSGSISLTGQGYETLFDPDGQGPYLAKDLTAKGTLLSRYFGVTAGGLANGVALTSGQAPERRHAERLPRRVATSTPGTRRQGRAGRRNRLPCTRPTSSRRRPARGEVPLVARLRRRRSTRRAPAPSRSPARPSPRRVCRSSRSARSPTTPTCADRITGLSRLTADLAAGEGDTDAARTSSPGRARTAAPRPCAPGIGRGPARRRRVPAPHRPADPRLSGVPGRRRDRDLRRRGPAGRARAPTRAPAATPRPWQGKDIATAGGGRTGALVLSPYVKGGDRRRRAARPLRPAEDRRARARADPARLRGPQGGHGPPARDLGRLEAVSLRDRSLTAAPATRARRATSSSVTGTRPRAASRIRSTAATCRRLSRSRGLRSRRSTRPAVAARARSEARRDHPPDARPACSESVGPERRARRGASGPVQPVRAGPPGEAPRQCRVQRGGVRVGRSDEPGRLEAGEPQDAPARLDRPARLVGVQHARTRRPARARRAKGAAGDHPVRQSQVSRRPCWAIASPPARRSASHVDEALVPVLQRMQVGSRDDEQRRARRCRDRSSQSRTSATFSNVAGSTSWIATAISVAVRSSARRPARRSPVSAGRRSGPGARRARGGAAAATSSSSGAA